MITPYYLSLADLSDPDDPILKMCLPSPDELAPGGSLDTSGEADNTVLEGVQHKYKPTALMLSTNRCAMYCRHCFRKRLVGLSEAELNKRVDDAVNYLRAHKEVSNILISGGDSFMNSNRIIERYLHDLSQIDHLDFIRFGSRIPVTLPERIYGDSEFLDLFAHYAEKKAVYLVTQFNHPRELTEESLKAIRAMTARGVAVKNQTVLLRGVNDNAETLAELMRGLTRFGIAPYYVFQCRPVSGVKGRFQVPLQRGCELVDAAKSKQNGFGKCFRYAMSHPLGKSNSRTAAEGERSLNSTRTNSRRIPHGYSFAASPRPTPGSTRISTASDRPHRVNKNKPRLFRRGYLLISAFVFILARGLGLFAAFYTGALVIFLLPEIGHNTSFGTATFETLQRIFQRLVFFNIDFRHFIPSLQIRLSAL
jgi:KamA family protein